MESYLEILHEIADIITNSEEMRHIVEEKPEELKTKESELSRLREKNEETESRIEAMRKELAGIDMDLKANQLLHKKYENQLLLVKKAKEMTTLNNEIYNVKRIVEELTAKRHEKGDALEALNGAYHSAKEEYEAMAAELERERALVEEKISELKPEYDALKAMKADLLKKLPPHVSGMVKTMEKAGKFQHIIMATVNNGHCGVCKMQLPPQLVSEVRRAREVKQCPYCGRILFWDRT